MEAFTKTMAVKLRSHLDKYLLADDDRQTVRQSRTRDTSRTTWVVEPVEGRPHLIRLRSVHGTYLTGSDAAFLLGVTGKKVVQSSPDHKQFDWSIEWEPVRDGFQFRLRSWCGKFLRANGGTPPWRNTVTHDDPQTGTTTNWILWDVDSIDARWEHRGKSLDSAYASSLSNLSYESESGADPTAVSFSDNSRSQKQLSPSISTIREGMDFFRNAKAVRLRSHHDKYLIADDDEESVSQLRNGGSSPAARWSVEFVLNSDSIIRLKSCHGKYLTASNQPFLLGMTGRKVLQTFPRRLDSSVEWEPVRDGTHVRLKTRYGNFLRANSGPPPWRNSVTHDVPHRSSTQEWVLWDVDVIEIEVHSPTSKGLIDPISHLDSMNEPNTPSEASNASGRYSRQESSDSYMSSPPKSEGKTIYYHIAGEDGEVDGEDMEGFSMTFKGNTVGELTKKLEEETGIQDIFVCSRSPLNGKLFPLRLQLPPNIVAMHVVVVPRSSVAAEDF